MKLALLTLPCRRIFCWTLPSGANSSARTATPVNQHMNELTFQLIRASDYLVQWRHVFVETPHLAAHFVALLGQTFTHHQHVPAHHHKISNNPSSFPKIGAISHPASLSATGTPTPLPKPMALEWTGRAIWVIGFSNHKADRVAGPGGWTPFARNDRGGEGVGNHVGLIVNRLGYAT